MMPNQGNPMQMIMRAMQIMPQFLRNPVGAMMSVGLNVPPNIQDNPGAILNYLMNSGKMTPDQYNQCEQLANMAQPFLGKKP